MKRIFMCIVMVMMMLVGGFALAQDDQPTDAPTVEAVQEATVEATQDVTPVVDETPAEQPAESWLKPEHLIFILAFLLLGFSHPPQTGKLFNDIMKRVQEHVDGSATTADDTILAILKPMIDQVQARLDAVDAALATVPRDDAKG